jgi:hypothetical protein
MSENIALLKNIALKSGGAWFKILFFGILISVLGIIASFALYENYEGATGLNGLSNALRYEFWTVLLFFGSLALLIFSVIFANKYALHTTLSLIWKEKAADFVAPKLQNYIANITVKQPNWLSGIGNASAVKVKLLGEMRFDSSLGTINKKVLQYGFKKINMDDVDFSQPNIDFPAIISYKINEQIAKIAQPSIKPFWISVLILVIILGLAIFFKVT